MEAVQPGGLGTEFEIWLSLVPVPLSPPGGFVPGSLWFNSLAALVDNQLVCLLAVGVLNLLSLYEFLITLSLFQCSPRRLVL